MAYDCFEVEIADSVAHIRLNRPDAFNTMIPEFWRELPAIVRDIDDNAKARAIVVSSTGKHFCAGMDLSVFTSQDESLGGGQTETGRRRLGLKENVKHLQETFNCLDEARIPVLAAIHGGCVGGAVDMTSACDIRYATRDAFFVIQEINIGMTADVGTFPRLCHLIPEGWVRELAYTGRRLPAEQAEKIGLVNRLYDSHEELVDGVLETAREIASKSPLAVTGSKAMINYARDHSIADALDYIAVWQTGMFHPTDMMEAFAAKGEKRQADYQDLLPKKRGLGA